MLSAIEVEVRARISEETPELIYPIKLEDALRTKIQLGRVKKSLGWIARNRPLQLEELMDKMEPGTPEHWALVCVYEYWEERVRKAVGQRNRYCQMRTRQGLQAARSRRNRARRRHGKAVC